MEKKTLSGVVYTMQKGLGIIKDIAPADIPSATDSDEFVNVTFSITRPQGENENNDVLKEMLEAGVDEATAKAIVKGLNVRTNTCLINLANFPDNLFYDAEDKGTLLPFTGIWVPVAQLLQQLGRKGRAVRLVDDDTSHFASVHKYGLFGFISDTDTFADRVAQRFLENAEDYESDTEVSENAPEDGAGQQPTHQSKNRRQRQATSLSA